MTIRLVECPHPAADPVPSVYRTEQLLGARYMYHSSDVALDMQPYIGTCILNDPSINRRITRGKCIATKQSHGCDESNVRGALPS